MKYVAYLVEIESQTEVSKYCRIVTAQCDRDTVINDYREWVHWYRRC